MLSGVTFYFCYYVCRYAEGRYVECRGALPWPLVKNIYVCLYGMMTPSIMTISITTFSLMTLSIKTFNITVKPRGVMALTVTADHCYAECCLR